MDDLISRQQAIDALETIGYDFYDFGLSATELAEVCEAVGDVRQDMIRMIKRLPSAQPEKRTDKRTETHECDLISRQEAIDEIRMCSYDLESWQKWKLITMLKDLPTAQPQ